MSELWYAYAVCRPLRARLDTGLTGVGGAPLRLVEHDGLVAVAGEVPERDFSEAALRARLENLDQLAAIAREHDRVLAALTRLTSPLPLRLATVFRGEDGVRDMLRARRDELRETLDALDGRVEWGVKVYTEPEPEPEPAVAGDGDAGAATGAGGTGDAAGRGDVTAAAGADRPVTGRDYLRRRRAEQAGRERSWQDAEGFAARLRRALAPYAAAERLHRPQSAELSGAPGRNVLNAAYLVDRDRAEEFAGAVRHASDSAPGLRVELTGPWAAYSFSGPAADTGTGGAVRDGAVVPEQRHREAPAGRAGTERR